MANYESGASATGVAGAERRLEDVTVAELMAVPPSPARPSWALTRYPVTMDEYYRLVEEARKPAHGGEAAQQDESHREPRAAAPAAEAELEIPEDVATAAPAPNAPNTLANFAGLGQTSYTPPDNTIAVGPNNVLIAVNADLAGYSKTGALQFRWVNMTTLFSSVLPSGASIFDPRVAYDHYAGRWIVVAGGRRTTPAGSWIMVGVSQGPNPSGGYWVWAFDASVNGSTATNNWADYPTLGFDTQAIYVTANMFQVNGGFQYVKLRIFNKAELYGGGVGPTHNARWYDFWNLKNPDNSVVFTMQPAVHFRGVGGNPAAYLVSTHWPTGSTLTLWTLNNPLALWTGGAPSLANKAINCTAYDLPPQAAQKGSTTTVATNDSRLLNAMYQNAGNVQRLWTCHTTKYTWPGETEARSIVQWYEIDVPSASIAQQGRFGAPGAYYFFPAIQTDNNRNAFVVFSRSTSSEYVSVRQTGRKVTDAAGSLQGSAIIASGSSSYTGGRWGDYFGICRDPSDTTVVWMYGEYAGSGNTWATQICSARF